MTRRLLKICFALFIALVLPGWCAEAELTARCVERAAIERVYYTHRIGAKPPFEETLPRAALESLVRKDEDREKALDQAYGVKITAAMLEEEVQRIHRTTRAPEMLAEIKAALRNDPGKFAHAFAKSFLVERLLRDKFDNDDALHSMQRRIAESARARALATAGLASRLAALKGTEQGHVEESVTWELTPRPESEKTEAPTATPNSSPSKTTGGLYTNEASAQIAQVLASPDKSTQKDRTFFFEDLPAELKRVLHAQLRQPADVSAVIETPSVFQIYLARECSTESLTVAIFTVRKRSFEAWLAERAKP